MCFRIVNSLDALSFYLLALALNQLERRPNLSVRSSLDIKKCHPAGNTGIQKSWLAGIQTSRPEEPGTADLPNHRPPLHIALRASMNHEIIHTLTSCQWHQVNPSLIRSFLSQIRELSFSWTGWYLFSIATTLIADFIRKQYLSGPRDPFACWMTLPPIPQEPYLRSELRITKRDAKSHSRKAKKREILPKYLRQNLPLFLKPYSLFLSEMSLVLE